MSSKCFSPPGSQTILFSPYQTSWRYSDGDPLNGGVECRWGRQKSRFWAYIWLLLVLSTLRSARCYQHGADGLWQVVTFIAVNKRRSLLMAGDDDEMFVTRSIDVTPKTTEQHLIVCSDKSVAYVTNNKRLYSTFCTIEANYWQTQSIARPLRQQSFCRDLGSLHLPIDCIYATAQNFNEIGPYSVLKDKDMRTLSPHQFCISNPVSQTAVRHSDCQTLYRAWFRLLQQSAAGARGPLQARGPGTVP